MQCSVTKILLKNSLFWIFSLLLFTHTANALSSKLPTAAAQPLAVEQAFFLNLLPEATGLKAEWIIAPGTYLYKDKIHIFLLTAPNQPKVTLSSEHFPAGEILNDPFFGPQNVYQQSLTIPIAFGSLLQHSTSPYTLFLEIAYQGCGESGFCYPPQVKWFEITLIGHKIASILPLAQNPTQIQNPAAPAANTEAPSPSLPLPHVPNLSEMAQNHHILIAIATFYFLGVLLSFTPCVLPMIPILLGIIVGQKHVNTRKAFWISLSYVLSMAMTYALAGIIAATLGKNLQARLQNPAVILSFAGLFVLLGLMQMGIVRLSLPSRFQLKELFTRLHHKQTSGTYVGAAVMGFLATLISSPCVTAPLIGALSYISQSGNIMLGGSALLALGLGMGSILLVVGTVGGKILPQSGPWMQTVNHAFAIMMFGLSLWLIGRVLHTPWMLVLWAIWCFFIAWCMQSFKRLSGWNGRVGMLFILYGFFLLWGAWQGETALLNISQLNPWKNTQNAAVAMPFQTASSASELTALQEKAIEHKHPSVVVFYANWCTSCQHLERKVFTDKNVFKQLTQFDLIHADVSAYNEDSQKLLEKFNLIGPPAILFFDTNGTELTQFRIIGEISTTAFLDRLTQVQQQIQPSSADFE